MQNLRSPADVARARKSCPGGCGTRILLGALACDPCWEKVPVSVRARTRATNLSAAEKNAAREAVRIWLRDEAPPRDIAAERRADRAEERRVLAERTHGVGR